jgi:enoyl-[acyl-carrier protein] reductase I
MLHEAPKKAPLRRNVDTEDAGNAVVYLCSDWGSNVTGEILHVDAGYNVLGFWEPPAPAAPATSATPAEPAAAS